MIEKQIGDYEIIDLLGSGGVGAVYRAKDKRSGKEVAIKTLLYVDAHNRPKLYREARTGMTFSHPNIALIHSFGETDGVPYIVMESVKGETLEQILRETPALSIIEKLNIIAQICSALNYAHQRGVIHLDVKPSNVMVQPDGLVKLLDFGLARNPMQRPALLIGTLNYVAPEFLKGEPVDSRSDIFSTGVMLYQLLSGGIFPFSGNDFHAVANQIVNSPRLPLSKHLTAYLPELDGILNRALAKDPNHRYSAAEFETDLIALRNKLDGQLGHLLQLARHEMSSGSVRVFEIINQIKAINPNLPELKDLLTNVYVKQKQEMEENLMSFSGAVVRSRRSYRTWVGEKIRRGAVVMADYAGWLSFVDRRVITSYLRYSQSSKMPEIVVDINRILLGSGMSALVLVGSWMLWMKGCQ